MYNIPLEILTDLNPKPLNPSNLISIKRTCAFRPGSLCVLDEHPKPYLGDEPFEEGGLAAGMGGLQIEPLTLNPKP
jgi:hypothetical protein